MAPEPACDDKDVSIQYQMRVIAFIAIFFGIIEIGIGISVYNFVPNLHVGGWWAGLVVLINGILGLVSYPRGTVIASCLLSIIAIIISLVAAILDGVAVGILENQRACVTPGGIHAGASDYYTDADSCYINNIDVNFDCYCTDGYSCYGYSGQPNCSDILGQYKALLRASTAICTVITVVMFVFSLLTCASLCCCVTDLPDSSSDIGDLDTGSGRDRDLDDVGMTIDGFDGIYEDKQHSKIRSVELPGRLVSNYGGQRSP